MVSPELPGIETFLRCPPEGTLAMVLHADGNHFCSIATRGHYAGGKSNEGIHGTERDQ